MEVVENGSNQVNLEYLSNKFGRLYLQKSILLVLLPILLLSFYASIQFLKHLNSTNIPFIVIFIIAEFLIFALPFPLLTKYLIFNILKLRRTRKQLQIKIYEEIKVNELRIQDIPNLETTILDLISIAIYLLITFSSYFLPIDSVGSFGFLFGIFMLLIIVLIVIQKITIDGNDMLFSYYVNDRTKKDCLKRIPFERIVKLVYGYWSVKTQMQEEFLDIEIKTLQSKLNQLKSEYPKLLHIRQDYKKGKYDSIIIKSENSPNVEIEIINPKKIDLTPLLYNVFTNHNLSRANLEYFSFTYNLGSRSIDTKQIHFQTSQGRPISISLHELQIKIDRTFNKIIMALKSRPVYHNPRSDLIYVSYYEDKIKIKFDINAFVLDIEVLVLNLLESCYTKQSPNYSPMKLKSVERSLKPEVSSSGLMNCPVCYEPVLVDSEELVITPCCQVRFHTIHLLIWLDQSHFCPNCRNKLTPSLIRHITGIETISTNKVFTI